MITTAFINIWGKRVGAIAWNANSGIGSFEYEPSFLNTNLDLSPIKMPILVAKKRIFTFPELFKNDTFKGMPGLIADVLPDKYGNAVINSWLNRQGRPTDSLNPVEKLCFIGKRGMGALEFEPTESIVSNTSTKIEISNLIGVAENILSGRRVFETNLAKKEEKALLDILKIGTSAGGARAKAVIAYNEKTGEVRSGQTEAPKDFSQWLIKFDGVTDSQLGGATGYGRMEMAYYNMAKSIGIEMMKSQLLEENDRAHFMTLRYDRTELGKTHTQSFCAIQHYDFNEITSFSYEQLFETLRILRQPYPVAEQLFRRMVFNVVARNCDDHTKNFAFIMNQQGEWTLSPAYDICFSYRPDSVWVSQQSLSVNGKRQGILDDDLMMVAKQMNIKRPQLIIQEIKETVLKWPQFGEEVGVSAKLIDHINRCLLNRLKN